MGMIDKKDYETVTARCDKCDALCVFNRIDDIGEPGPYSGRNVTCLECGEQFWIYGDLINPAYELFIFSADRHVSEKRYMLCVTTLAQAWEMFLATFAHSNFLYRPFFGDGTPGRDRTRLNRLASDLGDAMRRHTFDPLRNVLINTVLKGVRPRTLDESETAIPRIRKDNFGQQPSRASIEAFPDPSVREVLLRLQEVRVGELRNRVVHKNAYRPRLAEIERCRDEEIRVLYDVKNVLSVRTFEQWQATSRSQDLF